MTVKRSRKLHKRVSVDAAANTFTIHLTGNSIGPVKVAWLVLG